MTHPVRPTASGPAPVDRPWRRPGEVPRTPRAPWARALALAAGLTLAGLSGPTAAQAVPQTAGQTTAPATEPAPTTAAPAPGAGTGHDPALAARLGADALGMRAYVLVVLKTGPNRLPPGPARDAMFRGHFENMKRLSDAGQLVLAGPFDGVDGWRGLFIFAVKDIEEARQLAATDPVLIQGEMVAEYHRYYGSAALMLVREFHERLARPKS